MGQVAEWSKIPSRLAISKEEGGYWASYGNTVLDISKLHLWPHLSDENRDLIVKYSKVYILQIEPDNSCLTTQLIDLKTIGVIKALLLIRESEPSFLNNLDSTFWKKWLDIILHCSL
jgi:hypothetical protein